MNGMNLKNLNTNISRVIYFKKISERLLAKKKGNFKLADQIRE